MDSLTHVIVGAAIGQVALGHRVGAKAMAWGALAASIPDFDVVVGPFLHPVREIFFHRGITHSLAFVLLVAPLLGWAIARIHRRAGVGWRPWALLVLMAMGSHIPLDLLNTYGTGVLEPFTNQRFAFDSMAILDILLLLPILLGLGIPLLMRASHRVRTASAWGVLAFTVGYLSFSALNKLSIERQVEAQLARQGVDYKRIRTAPLPLTNFLWLVLAEDSLGYHVGYRGVFDRGEIAFRWQPRNEQLLAPVRHHWEVQELIRFAKGFYTVRHDNQGKLWIHDMRFGSMAFRDPELSYVFSFGLTQRADGLEVQRAKPNRRFSLENVAAYWHRVFQGG